MRRFKQAPFNFKCEYKDYCPHMNMSTQWASSEARRAHKKDIHAYMREEYIKALESELYDAHREIDRLKVRLKLEHSSKFKPNRKPKSAQRIVQSEEPDKPPRPRGAPVGHPPWNRAIPDHIDRTVNVDYPVTCPHCNTTDLKPTGATQTQIQEDIVLQPQTVVTEYIHELARCPQCRRDVFATGAGELRNCEIGPVTKATATYLRHSLNIPYRGVQSVFKDLFGMPFVPASAMNFDRTIAQKGLTLYEELRETVRAASIIYADETSWRIDGKGAYVWYVGNRDMAFFQIDRSRSSRVAVEILGDDFQGALSADGYAGYNAVNAQKRQSCLAHLTRKAKELIAEIMLLKPKYQDEKTLKALRSLRIMFSKACKIGARRNNGELSQTNARKYIPHFYNLLNTICLRPFKHKDAETFRLRLLNPKKEYNRLFTFLKIPGMEPTNNHAEQALRKSVIFRKICFGNRSAEGAQSMGTILSLATTAKLQKQDPLAFFQTLITEGPEEARKLLFSGIASP